MTLKVNNADYYQTLEVSHAADFREIGAGYWRLARGAGSEQRAELNAAYETLNDEDRRRAYDAQWAEAGHANEPRPEPANVPPAAVMAQLQPADRAEANQHVEERCPEPAPAQPVEQAKADLEREEGRRPSPCPRPRSRKPKCRCRPRSRMTPSASPGASAGPKPCSRLGGDRSPHIGRR
jgi:curved DNA-binding protein CbpA